MSHPPPDPPRGPARSGPVSGIALRSGNWLVWPGFALLLLLAPLLFRGGAALSILSQIGTLMIFGLSYNMLLGQGGMLSFGHSLYSGLGAFFAVHALNLAGQGSLPCPVSLIPLLGGLAGMGFGLLFGYLTTRKSGTPFAMITLGLVELVFACSLMFPQFFGGEGGVSANRVVGQPVLGISFGPQIEVYYLIAFWLFASTVGMYAFTRTPLGRILNAVRDNPERVGFIGYDARWVRYLAMVLSAFFAGISGGLAAINFELVTAENVSAARSGAVLLYTFIGGTGHFFGPMLGALVGVFLSLVVSEWTHAWPLYLGLFFVLLVMHAPGGLAGLLVALLSVARGGLLGRVWRPLMLQCLLALVGGCGVVLAVEMTYHLALDAANGTRMSLFGVGFDAARAPGWLLAAALAGTGWIGFRRAAPRFLLVWDGANAELGRKARRGPE